MNIPKDKMELPPLDMGRRERKEADLPLAIKGLEEEELQIAELTEIEKAQLTDLASSLKALLKSLDTPLHVDSASFSPEVVVTPEGMARLENEGVLVASIPIESIPSQILIKMLMEMIPDIKR